MKEMNERIKELWVEGTQTCIPREGDYSSVSSRNIEKFAELIVRECAKTSKKYVDKSIYSSEYEDCGLDCMSGDLEQHILEHFGIEE